MEIIYSVHKYITLALLRTLANSIMHINVSPAPLLHGMTIEMLKGITLVLTLTYNS